MDVRVFADFFPCFAVSSEGSMLVGRKVWIPVNWHGTIMELEHVPLQKRKLILQTMCLQIREPKPFGLPNKNQPFQRIFLRGSLLSKDVYMFDFHTWHIRATSRNPKPLKVEDSRVHTCFFTEITMEIYLEHHPI